MASVNTSGFHRSFAFSCARKAARFEAARVEADAGGGEVRAELGHGVQHRSVRLVCLACTFKTLNNAIYERHQRGLSTLFVERDHVGLNIRVSIVACMPCIQQLRLNVVPTVFM